MVVGGYFFILSRVAGYFSFVLAEITRQRAFGRLFCVIFAEISGQLVFGGVLHSPFDTKNPPKGFGGFLVFLQPYTLPANDSITDYSSVITFRYWSPQSQIDWTTGANSLPMSVRWYSTFGGTTG